MILAVMAGHSRSKNSVALLASVPARDDRHELFEPVLEEMAESSAELYRSVVHDDPDFVRFFTEHPASQPAEGSHG